MTMPDILINTENIFLNRGICELLSEIAKEEHIREPYSVVDCSTDILGPIDMLFTEMAAGEHYLCHPFFKKLPPHTSIFIFVATDSALQVEQLPLCLRDATFISMNSDYTLSSVRMTSQFLWPRLVGLRSNVGTMPKDS